MKNITHSSLWQLFNQHFAPLCRFLTYYTSDRMTIKDVLYKQIAVLTK